MPAEQDSHNTFAYPGFPYPNTHPDRLAAMAILHGLSPGPVDHCRVLEIGCNEGANLIPMAYAIPSSEFVGFDLARLRIEYGQERIRALGLKNIRLFQGDLLELGTELGQFDYIVAHGFYAWVPELVRERMMALCGELLSPDGVAFVSYNAMPGGHLRVMLREMMLYHVKHVEDPRERVTGYDQPLDRRIVGHLQGAIDPERGEYQENARDPHPRPQYAEEDLNYTGRSGHTHGLWCAPLGRRAGNAGA